jgi:hypothetical protein
LRGKNTPGTAKKSASTKALELISVAMVDTPGIGKLVSTQQSSAPYLVPKVSVVTPHRKEELLLKARAERRQWIEKVPLPYTPEYFCPPGTTMVSHISSTETPGNDLWTTNIITPTSNTSTPASGGYNCLYKLQSSVLCQKYLPSTTATISELYGLPTKSLKLATLSTTELLPSIPLNRIQVAERVGGLVSKLTFVFAR